MRRQKSLGNLVLKKTGHSGHIDLIDLTENIEIIDPMNTMCHYLLKY